MASGTILFVDDDDAIRAVIRSILELRGYRVIDVGAPALALSLFEQNPAAIDLLITDVKMPGMSGLTLADRLSALRPDLPVLFISGGADPAPVLARRSPRRRMLTKPFEAAVLLEAAEALLATTRG